MTARVSTAPRALAQLLAAGRWWREHRPSATNLLDTEIAAAYALLARMPEAGRRFPTRKRRGVRRLLLRRSKFHVYYIYFGRRNEVLVVAVWPAVRGQGPPLDLR